MSRVLQENLAALRERAALKTALRGNYWTLVLLEQRVAASGKTV